MTNTELEKIGTENSISYNAIRMSTSKEELEKLETLNINDIIPYDFIIQKLNPKHISLELKGNVLNYATGEILDNSIQGWSAYDVLSDEYPVNIIHGEAMLILKNFQGTKTFLCALDGLVFIYKSVD